MHLEKRLQLKVLTPLANAASQSVTTTLQFLKHTEHKNKRYTMRAIYDCRRRCKSDYSQTSSVLQVDLHGVT